MMAGRGDGEICCLSSQVSIPSESVTDYLPSPSSYYHPLPATMSARVLALRRGKTGDTQNFSRARPADPAIVNLVQSTLGPAVNPAFRQQVLNDPGNVQQFACVFGDTLGFFTRPVIVPVPGGRAEEVAVVGSFTDTIGEAFICSTTLEEFQGNFTTLVRREDAETYSLATHPVG